MKRPFIYALALFSLLFGAVSSTSQVLAQKVAANSTVNSAPIDVDKIIRAFSAKETEFRRALNEYAFKRDAVFQVIGMGGQIAGEYHRVSQFTFDSSGNRYEKIIFFPMPSYSGITAEDIEDMSGVNPFALEAGKIDKYNFTYAGKERIDELDLYIFDVAPKVMPDPKKTNERLFVGRIWVDDKDFQIVKSRGKGVPETKNNKFPNVETYREQIDGRFWFPTYSYADEELVFGSGEVLHLRLRVKYTDFVKGHAEVIIKDVEDGGKVIPNQTAPQTTELQGPVEGAVLNSRAIELPQPVYPEEAKPRNVHGTVKVEVTVDEEGNVSKAAAVEGPKELREAAVAAAKKARFKQTVLHGAPIKISGYLVYKF